MGISRRKAGTVVRCPKCAGEIIVPVPDGSAGPEDAAEQAGGQAFDVEKLDFGVEPVNGSIGATAVTPGEPAPPESLAPPASAPAPPKRVGVFVPLGMLIISIGVVVLLLILMLIIGLIIGRATMVPAEIKSVANGRSSPGALESPSAALDPARNSCRA
jgi:hypothetical protein